ncbi:outer membrane usher protein [Sinobacterium caligoides]|uniref:Outer membrane usher protein n=1 Tax=Sinobacterium caligoides TaxID=933926 RepID=A0A3N2DMP3_9GAMM|nr:fimbria/pilus outer membrane usher protein [Sinobacterium caligoides]ROS01071.1 outer membrane usher protein [Sinobacterium caligoides]
MVFGNHKKIYAAMMLLSFTAPRLYAKEYFSPAMLGLSNEESIDLSVFSDAGGQSPGVYRVDIYLNENVQDTRDVNFIKAENGQLQPELTIAELKAMGVDVAAVASLQGLPENQVIDDLGAYIPQASSRFDFTHQQLHVSVPQAMMQREARGLVKQKYWDDGLPVLMTNYSLSGSNSWNESGGGRKDSYYANLRSGINVGGWRLRNYSVWSQSSGNYADEESASEWSSLSTYAVHDVRSIKGRATLGDASTPSDVFDSLTFRGVKLESADNMLPDSLRGYAPTIRGIANSNAQVTVRQSGAVIYQSYVPAGEFVIDDLYPSSGGDLEVTITEADGSEHSFSQPFASLPVMQREGRLKYGVAVGKYRSWSDLDEPVFSQSTLIYGLGHGVTVYGGLQNAENYNAAALGFGLGLGDFGSISLDVTHANTALEEYTLKGQSYRFQYAKTFQATGTAIALAGYRYSTEGFYSFEEAVERQGYMEDDEINGGRGKRRRRAQFSLNQPLGGSAGSLYTSVYQQDYWSKDGYERNINVGYSKSWSAASLNVSYNETEDSYYNDKTRAVVVSVNVPLGSLQHRSYGTASVSSNDSGETNYSAGIYGTALEGDNLGYSVQQRYGNRDTRNSGSASINYDGTYAELDAGYSYTAGTSQQVNYGAQGSIVAHPYGVTFGHSMSDMTSAVLVRAPGAAGVGLKNSNGVATDWRGYTVLPYVSPYRRTRVALNTESLGESVDIIQNVSDVVPTQGAVVLAEFKTKVGSRALLTLTKAGKPVPFGATVIVDGNEEEVGMVSSDGQVYLSGLAKQGSLLVRWGDGDEKQCRSNYTLPQLDEGENGQAVSIQEVFVECI